MAEDLDAWRQEIRGIDSEIIRITARRMELALKIGQYKADNRLPVKDFRVEKEIVERSRSMAASLGLAPDFIEDLMTLLMGHSVHEQNKLHQARRQLADSQLKDVLIIGGLGRMGKWFSQYFQSIGFQVSINDINADDIPDSYARHVDLKKDLNRYEIILLACPLTEAAALLQTLAEQKPQGMIIETSSLKSPIIPVLKTLQAEGLKIASIHPMFGPDTDLLLDKNILICKAEGLCSNEAATLYFHSTSANLVTIDLQSHDEIMLSTLGLAHLINLLFGITLSEQNISVKDGRETGGATFLHQTHSAEALLSENHELYFDIQALNPHRSKLYEDLQKVLSKLTNLVETGDRSGFLALFDKTRHYFQDL
ncbi:MAG: prephenate dehydrogenase/arogenate dehydrogenase family protein [Chitinophagaceae bacterium]|nr:prephenate dehydrogenase/arogenate dehydrogenase family protein [Oligoflexus sp.]